MGGTGVGTCKPLLFALMVGVFFLAEARIRAAPPEAKVPPWELARSKSEAARRASQAIAQEYLEGKATVEQVHQWSQRWLAAQREASGKKADQLAAIEAHIERMRELEKAAK